MKIRLMEDHIVVDGEGYLTILPRGETALSIHPEALSKGVSVRNCIFTSARGKTRLSRWLGLCKEMWHYSA